MFRNILTYCIFLTAIVYNKKKDKNLRSKIPHSPPIYVQETFEIELSMYFKWGWDVAKKLIIKP